MPKPDLVAIVAMARNGVIGKDGAMPWRMPSDLRRYRRLTMDKPMIMGRKTLDAIGRVLDGRDTIVLTHSADLPYEGALLAHSPETALDLALQCAQRRGADEIAIVGGAEIYGQFLDLTDRLMVTEIDAEVKGDAIFPPIDPSIWHKFHEEACPRGETDSAASRFVIYQRRRS
ncbi:dihydrofolate reductase [Aurantimonas marina]|uniref:dihydrofolate reductase n=1 Tax=Aurantimonas marina TaxID=2780508 RepID=UPI0019D126B2|nr:dihydrofolate reductase [Aurantimonas marina]